MSISKAWAPGHATLFFAVPIETNNLLSMGSLGGGINFSTGVETTVQQSDESKVFWNEEEIDGIVSLTVFEDFKEKTGQGSNVIIKHNSELKIGHGLSTSGAGAIGTALALNDLFRTQLSQLELYQIAHIADAKNRTGLGSVMGQITSGIELRIEQGGPGIGKTKMFHGDAEIFLLMLGQLKTSDVLISKSQMDLVTKSGMDAINEMNSKSDENILDSILDIGRNFTKKCGLVTENIEKLMVELEKIGEYNYSMAMIGETLVIKPTDKIILKKFAKQNNLELVKTRITNKKPYLMNTIE